MAYRLPCPSIFLCGRVREFPAQNTDANFVNPLWLAFRCRLAVAQTGSRRVRTIIVETASHFARDLLFSASIQ
jgi:hypothetical protein